MSAPQPSIAFSGSIPQNYDRYLGPLFFEPFALDMAERVRALRPKNLLEVACGTGRATRHFVDAISPGGAIVATDINPAMVAYASNQLGLHRSIQWDIVDAVSLPYPDNTFDCIVSQFGVMFYSDRPKAYAEALRVLKPGGMFLFTAWDKIEHNPVARLTDETITDFFPIDTPAFYKVPFSYHNEYQIRDELAAGGFEEVHTVLLRLTGHSADSQSAARGLLEGTPVFSAIVERDESLLPPMRQALSTGLAETFGAAQLDVPLQARLVVAMKQS